MRSQDNRENSGVPGFYEALGFEATYKQSKPYVYLALRWSGFQLHFGPAPEGLDPAREESGGCLVMVLGEPTDPWLADLRGLELTQDDRRRIESELGHLTGLQEWLPST